MFINGLEIIVVDHFFESSIDIPRRRSKSKRIQKKFNKKYGFMKKIDNKCFVFQNKIFCHSKIAEQIKRQLKGERINAR